MLHCLWLWLCRSYNDVHLARLARITLAEDTLLADLTQVSVTSAYGIIRLKGYVPTGWDKTRIELDIRGALDMASLPYVGLINALQMRDGSAGPSCLQVYIMDSIELNLKVVPNVKILLTNSK